LDEENNVQFMMVYSENCCNCQESFWRSQNFLQHIWNESC